MSFQQLKRYIPVLAAGGLTVFAAIRVIQHLSRVWPQKTVQLIKQEERICIVTSPDEWDKIFPCLQEACQSIRVVGLDCEWVPSLTGEKRRSVALLQIACISGLCVLVRLCHLANNIPLSLKSFLADKSILKAGVAIKDDGQKLLLDYGIPLKGGVDLRHVLSRVRGIYHISSPGLKGLSKAVLNVNLEKTRSIRCGNWESETLQPPQIKYAALDAIVGLDIFINLIVAKKTGCRPNNKSLQSVFTDDKFWQSVIPICQGIIDIAYTFKQNRLSDHNTENGTPGKHRSKLPRFGELSCALRSYSTRQSPLYHNCKLQAPDGELLCTCDERKAYWYMDKKLGEKICDDPLTVRLFFEPSGRPDSSRNYYLHDKDNICVVCGATENYIRKIIVPHEYRKYFPFMMKEHASHDVLLLCAECHAHSSQHDSILRQQLADQCNAPLDFGSGTKMKQDPELYKIKSAAKALKFNATKLPAERRETLESIVKTHYGVKDVTRELLDKALETDSRIYNSYYTPHGLKVVEYIRLNEGLVSFEKMWRQHFLDTMKPQFLPMYWSVDHNHERLAQFDETITNQLSS